MRSLSRIVKASYVTNSDDLVNIEIMPPPVIATADSSEPDSFEELNKSNDEETLIAQARMIAEDIMRRARQDAQSLQDDTLRQAEAQAELLLETSRAKGYEEGYNQGYIEAEAIKEEARQIHQQALIQRDDIINSIETDMVNLVTGIVSKLLSAEIQINPQVILNLIKQGLSDATLTGIIRIHVSQVDHDYVSQNRDALLAMFNSSATLEIVKDMSLNQSDCVIETPFGNIDCSLTQQYEELKKDLYYILENR